MTQRKSLSHQAFFPGQVGQTKTHGDCCGSQSYQAGLSGPPPFRAVRCEPIQLGSSFLTINRARRVPTGAWHRIVVPHADQTQAAPHQAPPSSSAPCLWWLQVPGVATVGEVALFSLFGIPRLESKTLRSPPLKKDTLQPRW